MNKLNLLKICLQEGLREITKISASQGIDVFLSRFKTELLPVVNLVDWLQQIDRQCTPYKKEDFEFIVTWLMENENNMDIRESLDD